MDKAQLKQLVVIIAIIIIAAILLPFVAGLIRLLLRLVLFIAVVGALYWAYQTYVKKR